MLRGMLLPRTVASLVTRHVPKFKGPLRRDQIMAAFLLGGVVIGLVWCLVGGYTFGPRVTVEPQKVLPSLAEPVPREKPAGSTTVPEATQEAVGSAATAERHQNVEPALGYDELREMNPVTQSSVPASLSRILWPVEGEVARGYGYGYVPAYGDYRFHSGLDLAAPEGSAVVAVADGQVKQVTYDESHRWQVVLTHGSGWETVYRELARVEDLAPGSWVKAGAKLGSVGEAGREAETPAPHVHFELRCQGEARNPLEFLP